MPQHAYLRIADDLHRRIVKGRLAPGDKVPSRHELAREYEVSDRVAVEAVRLLLSEGYMESRSGSGTYVRRRPQFRSNSEKTTAAPAIAKRLEVAEGAEVMRTRYTFMADDEPVMMSTSWEPLELTRGTPVMLPEEGPYAGAGVAARMRAIGVDVAQANEVISARPILAHEAAALGEPIGTIVMMIQRTYIGERPVETADIVVPVDRYELAYSIPVD